MKGESVRLKIGTAALAASLALAGCSASATASAPASSSGSAAAAGQTIRILAEGGGVGLQKGIAEQFTKDTGVKVEFVEVPYADVHDKLAADISTGAGAYDLATIDVIWMTEFGPSLAPIDDLMTADVTGDLPAALVADAKFEDHFIGMPQWANAEILFYRKDLFADAKEQKAFKAQFGYDLVPPTTWQQYRDVAKFFNRPKDKLYGTAVKGAVETEWLAYVLQAGSPSVVLDKSGAVIIDDANHVKALEEYIAPYCTDKVGPDPATTDWAAAQNLFYQGQSAMMLFWAHAYRMTPEDSKVSDKVGVAPMIAGPGGIAAIPGPWYNVIPNDSPHADLAKQYIAYAYEHNAMGIDAPLGLAARTSAYEQFQDKAGYEAFTPLLTTLNAPATTGRPMDVHWQQITDQVLTPSVQKALTCTASPTDVLAEARTKIEAILKQ